MSNPGLDIIDTLVKILVAEGAVVVGQEGSHISLIKKGAKRRLVVPVYKEVPVS